MTPMDKDSIFISELAPLLDRRPATIREWERKGLLPKSLRSKRSSRGWRYWNKAQVEGIKTWMVKEDMRPGKGLKHYKPTPEQIQKHLAGQRKPRKRVEDVTE